MYSNHIKVFTGNNKMVLADFWVQSETPLSRQESAHIVQSMGWDDDSVKHSVIECLQIDDDHKGHKTLVEASLPLPSWQYVKSNMDNDPDVVEWTRNYWYECGLVDEAITQDAAYNLAVNWALSHGFSESDVIRQITVQVRYVENFSLASHPDDPF